MRFGVSTVFVAKLYIEQPFFCMDAAKKRRYEESEKQEADTRTKAKRPAERSQQQTEIARVTNEPIDAGWG